MLEVAVGIEVEANQDCDDFGIGHHALSAAFWGVRRGRKSVFCRLNLKFLAEIVCSCIPPQDAYMLRMKLFESS